MAKKDDATYCTEALRYCSHAVGQLGLYKKLLSAGVQIYEYKPSYMQNLMIDDGPLLAPQPKSP